MHSINFNGKIVPGEEPVLFPSNRAFRYGDGLFESIRIINGEVMLFERHIARLKKGMNVLHMQDFISSLNIENLKSEILELAKANLALKSGRVRLSVFRNKGGFYAPYENSVSYLIEAEPLETEGYELNRGGLALDIYEEIKKPLNKLSTLKSSNSLLYVMAGIWKQKNDYEDCIILNEKGNLCEAVSSNLFIVKNKELFTPSLEEGCVQGVMRENIILIAKQSGIPLYECPLGIEILYEADEVFLTNAITGIQWVGSYRKKRFFNAIGKILSTGLMP